MSITFFSFFMSVVWSSMVVMFFSSCLKKGQFIEYFGVTNLIVIYLVCVFRLIIPIEVPFVRIIGVRGVFAAIYERVFLDGVVIHGFCITMATLFMAVWLIGILVTVLHWVFPYQRAVRKIYSLKKHYDIQSEKVLTKVKSNYSRKIDVEVWQSPQVNIPMGIGVFRKIILLPEKNYTDRELYYILLHEYTHFINCDIVVKMLVHFLCCVFWWNPCVYLLKKEIDQTLEIKCDLKVTKTMDKNSKVSYLEVIIAMVRRLDRNKEEKCVIDASMLFRTGNDVAVVERFQVIMAEHVRPRRAKLSHNLCLALLCGTIGFSYLFQFQAEFPSPSLSAGEEVTPDNAYLIDNEDGTYTIVDVYGWSENTVVKDEEFVKAMLSDGFIIRK